MRMSPTGGTHGRASMMSQNRQAQKDHLRDDHEAAEVELLFKINQQQLHILHLLHKRLTPEEQIESQLEDEISRRSAALQEEAWVLEAELGVDTA